MTELAGSRLRHPSFVLEIFSTCYICLVPLLPPLLPSTFPLAAGQGRRPDLMKISLNFIKLVEVFSLSECCAVVIPLKQPDLQRLPEREKDEREGKGRIGHRSSKAQHARGLRQLPRIIARFYATMSGRASGPGPTKATR